VPENLSEKLFAPQPEIHHQFRKPEKRPSLFMSQLFTAAVLAPAVILLIGLLRLGANLSGLPTHPIKLLFALGYDAFLVVYIDVT